MNKHSVSGSMKTITVSLSFRSGFASKWATKYLLVSFLGFGFAGERLQTLNIKPFGQSVAKVAAVVPAIHTLPSGQSLIPQSVSQLFPPPFPQSEISPVSSPAPSWGHRQIAAYQSVWASSITSRILGL